MSRTGVRSELYDASSGPQPTLRGGRCLRCGQIFFPMQHYGCERCGAFGADLEAVDLPGVGTLLARADVHLGGGAGVEAPFAIGEIALEAGPVVRVTLADGDPAPSALGTRMCSVLVPTGVDADGNEQLELRFAPSPERA